jgi:hypothetical protein
VSLILLAALPILLTEYGFQSRARIIEGFNAKWRFRRFLVRFAFWFILLFFIGLRPIGFLVVGLGWVLTELGTVILRRRLRIDIDNQKPNGLPQTHLIPLMVGILFVAIWLLIRQPNRGNLLAGPIEFGSLAPLILFSVIALWGWATMITISVVDLVRPGQVRESEDGVGAGEVIGVLERIVTFVLVASGAFTAVGFVIAAKAAARFPLFKETAFAEYFLIGTLTSVGLALLFGLLVLSAL